MRKQLLFFFLFAIQYTSGQIIDYRLKDILNVNVGFPYDLALDAQGNMYVLDNYYVLKLNPNGRYLSRINIRPGAPPEDNLSRPMAMTLDARGNVYVVDYSLRQVRKYNAEGVLVMQFGAQGTGDEQFEYPEGITVDQNGAIYVVDSGNRCVKKFNGAGQYLQKIGSPGSGDGQFTRPTDVSVDAGGNVYVADPGNHRIQKFSPSGQLLLAFGGEGWGSGKFQRPDNLAVDAGGNIYVGDNYIHSIFKFSATGQYVTRMGAYASTEGNFSGTKISLAFDTRGNVYAADRGHGGDSHIQKFSPTGQFLARYGTGGRGDGQFFGANGIAVDAAGNFFVSESDNVRIQKFSPSGQLLLKFGSRGTGDGQFIYLQGITTDPAGNLYTLDNGGITTKVQKFDPLGRFVRKYEFFSGPTEGDKEISGIAVDAAGTIYLTDYYGACVHRFNAAGARLPSFGSWGPQSGQFWVPRAVAVDASSNVYVVDLNGRRIQKFTSEGQLLLEFGSFQRDESPSATSAGIALDANGKVYVYAPTVGPVHIYNAAGQLVQKLSEYTGRLAASRSGNTLLALGNNSVYIFAAAGSDSDIVRQNTIAGRIFRDGKGDCTLAGADAGMPGILVEAQPGPHYAVTDSLGNYTLAVDTGTYTVRQILPQDQGRLITQTCPAASAAHTVAFRTYNDTVAGQDFGNQVTLRPYLTATVGSTRRRRCFPGTTALTYCNTGSLAVADARVHLELPPHVVLVSAGAPYTVAPDKHLVFNVGALAPNGCGTIRVKDSVVCDNPNIRGLTQCTKVWITPANGVAPDPNWDRSDIALKAKCLPNGRVRLGLYNTGTGAMTDSSAYRLYLDAKLVLSRKFKLAAGDSLMLQVPAEGQTVRLEADQRPGHPTKQSTNVTLEACGTNAGGTVSLGFVAQLPQDDAEPEADTECLTITDSFDPNDKLVLPAGVTAEHYTAFGQELEYTVRFQNTGNDYAYRVVLVDTLSDKLDVSTLRVNGASHPYGFTVSGKGRPVLTFTFNNINLPDSTRDQAGSNGFAKFTIKPLQGLPEKTRIENFADIFFDYNPPVRTNTTLNTLYDLPLEPTGGDAPPLTVCRPNPPVTAGPNQVFCEDQTTALRAELPAYGGGRWKRISGAGRIAQPHLAAAAVEGLGYGDNVFEWSIADGTCANDSLRARVTVTRHRGPATPTIAYLGINDLQSSVEGETYQWHCNGRPLADHTRSIKAIRGGVYTVRVSGGGCTSPLSSPFDFKLTSPVLAVLSTVYPNPADGAFTVALPGGVDRVTLSLFDAQGRKVAESTAGNPGGEPLRRTFQLPGGRAGVYLLKIQTADALVVKRVVLR